MHGINVIDGCLRIRAQWIMSKWLP